MGLEHSSAHSASWRILVLCKYPGWVFQFHAIDGSTEMGLFSANSAQSIVFWIASIAIWLLGILAIFKPQVRKPVFFIMAALSVFSMGFIEASRIWLYHAAPIRFTLL